MAEHSDVHLVLQMESKVGLFKEIICGIYFVPLKDIDMKLLVIHLVEYLQGGSSYVYINGLLNGISLGQTNVAVMGYSVIVVDVEVNMSKLESVIWVF